MELAPVVVGLSTPAAVAHHFAQRRPFRWADRLAALALPKSFSFDAIMHNSVALALSLAFALGRLGASLSLA